MLHYHILKGHWSTSVSVMLIFFILSSFFLFVLKYDLYTKKILPLAWQCRIFNSEMLCAGRPAGSSLSAVYFKAFTALGIVGGWGLEKELDGNIGRILSAGGTASVVGVWRGGVHMP